VVPPLTAAALAQHVAAAPRNRSRGNGYMGWFDDSDENATESGEELENDAETRDRYERHRAAAEAQGRRMAQKYLLFAERNRAFWM
jgi:hypothetical protein